MLQHSCALQCVTHFVLWFPHVTFRAESNVAQCQCHDVSGAGTSQSAGTTVWLLQGKVANGCRQTFLMGLHSLTTFGTVRRQGRQESPYSPQVGVVKIAKRRKLVIEDKRDESQEKKLVVLCA